MLNKGYDAGAPYFVRDTYKWATNVTKHEIVLSKYYDAGAPYFVRHAYKWATNVTKYETVLNKYYGLYGASEPYFIRHDHNYCYPMCTLFCDLKTIQLPRISTFPR